MPKENDVYWSPIKLGYVFIDAVADGHIYFRAALSKALVAGGKIPCEQWEEAVKNFRLELVGADD